MPKYAVLMLFQHRDRVPFTSVYPDLGVRTLNTEGCYTPMTEQEYAVELDAAKRLLGWRP